MIIGTAGHIDHGKTALVRQLTGIDTDRLPEEKRRGMTIELGFAHMDLTEPDGIGRVGIIDVPGHERFIRTMVAGATGIDLVLLVVAADDGVMPQTREHLEIVGLLGIGSGVVALSKTDLVETDRVAAVEREIKDLLAGTALASSPIVPVSSHSGQGVDDLRRQLSAALGGLQSRTEAGFFWMSVDRSFVAPGFGAIGTGTIASGRVAKGDHLRLLPSGQAVRVRGIQVHNQPVDSAAAGSRCALNLAGVDKQSLRRGMAACNPMLNRVARTVDAQVTLVREMEKPLKSHSRVRLHSGTAETIARLQWIEQTPPGPGEPGLAQLRLEDEMPLLYGHRFVVRDETARRTLGGGVILDPFAARRGARQPERIERLRRLSALDGDDSLSVWLESRGADGWLLPELAVQLAEEPLRLDERLAARNDVWREDIEGTQWIALQDAVKALGSRLTESMTDYLGRHPRLTAVPPATLRSTVCPRLDRRIFRALLDQLAASGALELTPEGVRPVGHTQVFSQEDAALAKQVADHLSYGDKPPPKLETLARTLGLSAQRLSRFLGELERAGQVVRLTHGVYATGPDMKAWQDLVQAYLAQHSEMTVAQFRDEAGIGRGFAIIILEYFDHAGITKRMGNVRVAAPARNGDRQHP